MIAFFDLDRTILSINSASAWIAREVRLGYLGRWSALRGGVWIGMYNMGFARMETAIHDAVATLAGAEESAIRARTADFWREEVAPSIRPAARAALERHREEGHPVVLLTSSSLYLAELCQVELGLDEFLSNRFEVRDGRFTGRALTPLCFGAGKIAHAHACALRRGSALDRCAFYTDSYSDLPVLEAVGRPVAVNPDPRLRREAARRGWRIEDWSGSTTPPPRVSLAS